MKYLLHFPFLILFFFQVIIALLLKNDVIFLATAVQLGLFSTAFYSVCITLYTKALLPQKWTFLIGSLSLFIVLTTFFKVYFHVEWMTWTFIMVVQFFQIQLFFGTLIRTIKLKWSMMIVGTLLFLALIMPFVTTVNLPISLIIGLLSLYSILIITALISKNTVYEN